MRKLHVRSAVLLAGILLSSAGAVSGASLVKTEREISRSFEVAGNASLVISNKYGIIAVSEWDRNEIFVSVKVTGFASNEETSRNVAESISVDFSRSGNNVTAVTNIAESRILNGRNVSVKIDYTVKVPASVRLALTNKYGDISLDRTARPLTVDLSYGKLTAGALTGEKSDIRLAYGSMDVSKAGDLSLGMKYSKARVATCGTVDMTSAYSEFSTDFAGTVNASSRYDRFRIGTVDRLVLSSAAYGDFRIDNLQDRLSVSSLRYSQLYVTEVSPLFSSVVVDGAYSDIRLGIDRRHYYKAELYAQYATIKGEGITPKGDGRESSFSGTVGSGASMGEVRVSSRYGNITLGK